MHLLVSEADDGARLDRFLVAHVPDMSRAQAARLTAGGKVRLNGQRARKGALLRAGDAVVLEELPRPRDFEAAADPALALEVLYEDAFLVVVDKAAGVPSHPLRPEERGAVACALVARYPEMAGVGYARREPGIVHRLDNDTSGALLAARDASTFEALRRLLTEGQLDKRYLALVQGALDAPRILDMPLAPHPTDARRVVVAEGARAPAGRAALTRVVSCERVGPCSLVEVSAPSALRHQVRAHLAWAGHPLAGDARYGGPALPGLAGHFLHASRISLRHPRTGAPLRVEAPLPPRLAEALERAREL